MTALTILTVANVLIIILWVFLWRWTGRLNKTNADLLKKVKALNEDTKTMLKLEK